MKSHLILLLVISFASINCQEVKTEIQMSGKTSNAYFGGGCFWCTEAVFEIVKGVTDVESGYSGGKRENPTYEQVCSGATGHAEMVKITYDPTVVSYKELLKMFFNTHNPTTLNRQGNDEGTQYRSVIFYSGEEQKKEAEEYIDSLRGYYEDPIVTEVSELKNYYKAEDYHQDYFRNNPDQGYCAFVIAPKVKKFKKELEGNP